MARPVPISADNVRDGQAWWKCPYCKAGGQGLISSWRAEEAAGFHFASRHPFKAFRPKRARR